MKKLFRSYLALFFLLMFTVIVNAQTGIINTIAGNGTSGFSGDGGPATAAELHSPYNVATDGAGNVYIADYSNQCIRKVDPYGNITTFAGTGTVSGFSGDGGQATIALLHNPRAVATDGAGNVFIVDGGNNRIRKVNTTGIITTIAGTGTSGFSGDGGPATAANITPGYGLITDASGNVYYTDAARIRRIDNTGIITTIAGTGTLGDTGDGGPATSANIGSENGLAIDGAGNIYMSDGSVFQNKVRVINSSGIINLFAGIGGSGSFSGDGGPATAAALNYPWGLATDAAGNVYIGDNVNSRIRMVNTLGTIITIGGTGVSGTTGDSGPATAAEIQGASGLTTDNSGNIYFATNIARIRKITTHNHPPVFTGGHSQSLTICGNSIGDSINSLLAVYDSDYAQQEIWNIISAPVNGTAYVTDTMTSVHDTLHPHGMYYTPTPFYYGADSFKVRVTDGFSADTTTIHITINTAPTAISGTTNICPGSTTTLTDITGSCIWSSSNSLVATIGSSSGLVTGISTGTVTISYTLISDGCPATTTFTVNPLPSIISGATNVCVGATTACSDSVTGGVWSTGGGSLSIGSSTGVVTGVSGGSSSITYTLPTGCFTSKAISVNSNPAAITGLLSVCMGLTITLGDATIGGTWSTGSGNVSIGSATGNLTGISLGPATLTYTLTTGCKTTYTVSVLPLPATITGVSAICKGDSTTLSESSSGGAWSSSNTAIATVGSSSGTVTGIGAGIVTISYTLPSGCKTTYPLTINPAPSAISGTPVVCLTYTTGLSDSTTGGTWSSSDYSIAYIDGGSGIVTGISFGSAFITYTSALGCITTLTVSVNPGPSSISGLSTMCQGTSSFMFDAVSGGLWSSGSPSVVSINSVTGVDSALAAGVATINYSTGTGCTVSFPVTVNPLPATITGTETVCMGNTTTLSDITTGGTWSSASPVAAIGSLSGIVTGTSAGTALISYTSPVTGCAATATVTVNPLPGPITGVENVCPGATTILSCGGAGGSWGSSNTSIATVGSATGMVTGVAPGIVTITYTAATGCTVSATVTVNTLPGAITGLGSICVGAGTTYSDPATGGSWSRSNTDITIGTGTGSVTGVTAGTTIITYTVAATGCAATKTITVNSSPAAISGAAAVCIGATTLYTDATTGGVWSPATGGIATAGSTGLITGIAAGNATISYTLSTGCYAIKTITVNPLPTLFSVTGGGSYCAGGLGLPVGLSGSVSGTSYQLFNGTSGGITLAGSGGVLNFGTQTSAGTYTVVATTSSGCSRTMTGSVTITVNPLPSSITGPTALCVGATVTETDGTPGGIWSTATGLFSIGSGSGAVTGISTGSGTITYTLPTTCYTTATINVTTGTTAITGPGTVCAGATITLTDGSGGGVWSSSLVSHASIGSLSGMVTGIAAGTTTITYSLGSGCTATTTITVSASPAAITGAGSLCAGATTTLSDATTGGMWSAGAGSVSVSGSGVVTGVSTGTDTVYYTAAGCSATKVITVNATPTPISGLGTVCTGAQITATDGVSGGIWSTAAATLTIGSASGTITGITSGTGGITYSIGSCTTTRTITVNPTATISGATGLCTGTTSTLAVSVGSGSWLSGTLSVATVTTGGVVSGLATGTSVITYTTPAGCITNVTLTVNTGPTAISGAGAVCVGAQITLTDGAGGGVWSTTSGHVSIGSGTGTVTGVSAGTASITYSLGSGCTVTATVTVNATPAAITGAGSVCAGSMITLTDATPGVTWISGSLSAATISSTGVVTGITAGTAAITCGLGACNATTTITVNPLPATITGSTALCAGLTTIWSDGTGGGAWSCSSPGTAGIGSTGTVTGIAPGVATISYTLPTGCLITKNITINAAPAAISGSLGICTGSTTSLADASPGGVWSSSAGSVAGIGTTGLVTGISTGTATISYVVGGCPSLAVVTVNSLPAAITGADHVCYGAATTLSDATTGGVWSSSNTLTAAIGTGGVVNGVNTGTATISYSLGVGCTVTHSFTVDALPAAITGAANVCLGGTITLTDTATGGAWSSSNAAAGTISVMGVVTGTGAGTTTISYYVGAIGCAATHIINTLTVPPITGIHNICAYGDTMTVSDLGTGGLYTSSLATVYNMGGGLGRVTCNSPGTASVTYLMPSGCTATGTFTVNPLPGSISSGPDICVGASVTLTDGSTGGMWSASGGIVSIGSISGIVTGVSAGTTLVSYTFPATGCYVDTAITVTALPVAGVITGAANFCAGGSITLTDTATGGVWSTGYGSAVVGSTTGVVTGAAAGTDTIVYRVTNMCGDATAIAAVTINPLPDAGVITGRDSVCVGNEVTLTESVVGGIWSVSNSSAAINIAGLLGGLSAGMDTVIYTVSNAWCSASVESVVTVFGIGDCPALEINNTLKHQFANVQIYPNPAMSELIIKSTEKITRLTITNLLGQQLYTHEYITDSVQVNVAGLPNGIYYIKINGNEVRRFVKE